MANFHGLQVGGNPKYILTWMILQAGTSLWSFLIIQIEPSNLSNPSYWLSKSIATGTTSNTNDLMRLSYLALSHFCVDVLEFLSWESLQLKRLECGIIFTRTYWKFILYPTNPTIAYPRLRETLKKKHSKCMVFFNWSWTTGQIAASSEPKNLEILCTKSLTYISQGNRWDHEERSTCSTPSSQQGGATLEAALILLVQVVSWPDSQHQPSERHRSWWHLRKNTSSNGWDLSRKQRYHLF